MISAREHLRAAAWCAACPKLCSFACPVSNVTRNEAHTPWGKMTALHQHLSATRPLDDAAAAGLYACTGCLRCRTACQHANDVPQALFAARALAVDEGEAPKAGEAVRERFRESGNPYGADLRAARAAFDHDSEGRAYFPGCTALARMPDTVRAAIDAASGFGVRLALGSASARCCGYALWAAGLRAEFEAHAKAFAKAVHGLSELVVGDPGCAWAFLRAYRAVGVELKPRIVLLVDLLAERIELAFGRAPLELRVAWHDSCLLGRGLGRYDGPRRLLKAAVGDFFEAAENRADAGCCGAGGLLPRTMPQTALAIAQAQALELGAPGRRIVSACPTAVRQFQRTGAEATDLFTVLARWIRAGEGDDEDADERR